MTIAAKPIHLMCNGYPQKDLWLVVKLWLAALNGAASQS
jgi:hypothetical protein